MAALRKSRREKFCQLVARNQCDSNSAAYLAAGYGGDTIAAKANAYTLLKNDDVKERIAEIRGEHASEHWEATKAAIAATSLTRELVITELLDNLKRAKTGERFDGATANRACELLGKELGMFIERTEHSNVVYGISDKPLTAEQWAEKWAEKQADEKSNSAPNVGQPPNTKH